MRTANYLEGNPQGMDQTVFRTVYTISISAYVPPKDPAVFKQVTQIIGLLLQITQRPGATQSVLDSWTNETPNTP